MELNNILIIPLTNALIASIKMGEIIPTKFLPLISGLIGLILGLAIIGTTKEGAIFGLVLGFTAAGVYDAVTKPLK